MAENEVTPKGEGLTILLDLNGTPKEIELGDLTQIKEKGFEFDIDETVELGSLEKANEYLEQQFGFKLPLDDLKGLPAPLGGIFNTLEKMTFFVEKLSLKVPGTAAAEGETTEYSLRVSAEFANPESFLGDLIKIKKFTYSGSSSK